MSVYSRRRFLQTAILGGSTVALAPPAFGRFSNHADVLIIGAGMAGLAAAHMLRGHGVQPIVLEARDRIGGRVWTDRNFPMSPIDLGASWIHGAETSPLTPFCAAHGIQTLVTPLDENTLYMPNGEHVNSTEWTQAKALFATVLAGSQIYAALRQQQMLPDISMAKGFDFVFQHLPPQTLRQKIQFQAAQSWYGRAATGAELTALSLYHALGETSHGSTDRAFPGGYVQVAEVLATNVDIRLQHVVQKIDFSTSKIRVVTNRGIFTAPHVIITLPIGVLRSNRVQFTPDLPAEKQAAISRLRMGVLNKLYLLFPERFWSDDVVLMMHASVPENRWPVFANYHRISGKPILLGFNPARYGLEIEALTQPQLIASAMAALRTMFGSAIPAPLAAARSQWARDPFAGGCYPFRPLGSLGNEAGIIQKPVGKRLYFAGDCMSSKFGSTVRGAYVTGRSAAQRILDLVP